MLLRQLDEDDHDHAFSPEDVKVIVQAFEHILSALQLRNREDPLTTRVAICILELAKAGERDPERLRRRALAIIGARPTIIPSLRLYLRVPHNTIKS
jgi:hypothetical protein